MSAVEITTYSNAIRYLYDRPDHERMRAVRLDARAFKLDRIQALLKMVGNPENDFQCVHVAGTVGKGSTVAMVASMLRSCEYAVGEFTSPHLTDLRERIQINGRMIGRQEMTDGIKEVSVAAETLELEPTFFEIITIVAMQYFAEQAVDIAVIETGLGGRLDCTNVITPEVTAITEIAHDHTHILGDGLPQIAREKAGIFKPGVPALSVAQTPEVERVLRDVANETGCQIRFVRDEIEFSHRFGASAEGKPQTRICLLTATSRFEHIPVPLPGEHQAFNCGLALATIDVLKSAGYKLPDEKLHRGLAATKTPGRMEMVWDHPRILIDGAHNPTAITALIRSAGATIPYDSMVCIFGCCEDKDIESMLDRLALGGDKVIFTRARGIARAADPEDLQRVFTERSGKMSQVAADIGEALNLASRAVGREDLICVTGSFYLVGETKKHLAELAKKKQQKA